MKSNLAMPVGGANVVSSESVGAGSAAEAAGASASSPARASRHARACTRSVRRCMMAVTRANGRAGTCSRRTSAYARFSLWNRRL